MMLLADHAPAHVAPVDWLVWLLAALGHSFLLLGANAAAILSPLVMLVSLLIGLARLNDWWEVRLREKRNAIPTDDNPERRKN